MQPWIRERIERERREQEDRRIPLHIQEPPPEWIDEMNRRRAEHEEQPTPRRGVVIIEM